MSHAHFYDLDKQWETFVNHLKSPCLAARVPFMAPDLPPHGVDRAAPLDALLGQLLDASRANPVAVTVAVHGSGGFGKTTLAAQCCHRDEAITAFVDGILWATLGEKPNALAVRTLLALDAFAAEKLLETLDGLSLLRLDLKTGTARLHDVMHAYLASGLNDAAALHARLADAWSTTDRIPDTYAWRYVTYHMAEALPGTDTAARHERTTRLVALVTSVAFRQGHLLHVTDLPALRLDLDRTLECAQGDAHPDCPVLVARAALARSAMIELEPEQLFALARDGKLDKAEALLTLFDPEPHWRFATLLMLSWTAAGEGHDGSAAALVSRLAAEIPAHDGTLQSLLQYVRAATVPGMAPPPSHLPAPPDLFTISQVLKRLGGTAMTPIEHAHALRGAKEARTMREIMELYPSMRALPEDRVLALNPQLMLAGAQAFDQPLAVGAFVHITDDDFAPWIAARLASEALVADGLSPAQRSSLIRGLVPVAAPNATALDTILARSLMAAPIGDLAALLTLAQAAEELAKKK